MFIDVFLIDVFLIDVFLIDVFLLLLFCKVIRVLGENGLTINECANAEIFSNHSFYFLYTPGRYESTSLGRPNQFF